MKKLIALLLALVMVTALFAGCQTTDPDPSGNSTNAPSTGSNEDPTGGSDPAPSDPGLVNPYPMENAPAEEIPYTPIYKLTFDDNTNLSVVKQDRETSLHPDEDGDGTCDNEPDCLLDGATYAIVPSDSQLLFSNGPVGQCVYLDGEYGLKLENLVAPTDETYTISFWVNASRLSDFQPSLQIGRNIGGAGDDETVTWINVTQCPFPSVSTFPTIWNRNSSLGPDTDGDGISNGVWPWINRMDEDANTGKRNWAMITLVATGEEYEHVDATTGVAEPRIGCYMYVNGVEVMNGTSDGITTLAALSTYHGLSPEIFLGDGLEGYLGINYWDYTMKGYIDELYIYDEALTAGQVATLWAEGDASVETVEPEDAPVVEDPPTPTPIETVTPDANAIGVVGAVSRDNAFWSSFSNSYELAEGATVTMKLNNYSSCANNWSNYVIGLTNTNTTADLIPSADNYAGYAEYAVFRSDSYGWVDGATYAWTNSWTAWEEWLQLMADAEVTVKLTRAAGVVTVETTFVGADGTSMNSTGTITIASLTADAPCYFFVTGENSYVEILSVE